MKIRTLVIAACALTALSVAAGELTDEIRAMLTWSIYRASPDADHIDMLLEHAGRTVATVDCGTINALCRTNTVKPDQG